MIAIATPTLAQRRLARRAACAHASCPVDVVPGDGSPEIVGRSYYWTTPSGRTIVRHPNAYGWPTLYHASTLCVRVGVEWLASHGG